MSFFSIRLSVLCIVDEAAIPETGYTRDVQVHIVKACDSNEAFNLALEIGKSEETSYVNDSGRKVRWTFERVEAISFLGEVAEGEVSSRMEGFHPPEPLPFDVSFQIDRPSD